MRNELTSRSPILWVVLAGVLTGCGSGMHAQRRTSPPPRAPSSSMVARAPQQSPAPIERRPPPGGQNMQHPGGPNRPMNGVGRGEHLATWMEQHQGLSLSQQQQALGHEPGFQELPGQTQQRMRQRLSQLNAMSPQERQRILERTEVMERLSPDQRTQVRGAMQQLGSLPPDQRTMVARTFREIRDLPPEQRMAAMNSGRYNWLSGEQRSVLTNLIQVAPMLPPPQH